MPRPPIVPPVARLRDAAATLGRELGARLIVLFGSATRQEARPPEDLDIGVLTPQPLDAVAVTNRFMQLLHVNEVDITDLRRADPLLLMVAARDGIVLYEATPGEMTRFVSLAVRRYADTAKFRVAERDALREYAARLRGGKR